MWKFVFLPTVITVWCATPILVSSWFYIAGVAIGPLTVNIIIILSAQFKDLTPREGALVPLVPPRPDPPLRILGAAVNVTLCNDFDYTCVMCMYIFGVLWFCSSHYVNKTSLVAYCECAMYVLLQLLSIHVTSCFLLCCWVVSPLSSSCIPVYGFYKKLPIAVSVSCIRSNCATVLLCVLCV